MRRVVLPELLRVVLSMMLCALLAGCVQNVFFQPDNTVYDSPARMGLHYETISFSSRDGTQLSGWFIPSAGNGPAKGTVIHFHGNAQNMTAHWQFVQWLPQRGFNLFVFDYRGYGASGGKPGVQGVYEDSSAALDYVRKRPGVDPARLVVLGQSLGGTNAIAVVGAGNRDGVKAMVIEATFYSYSSIASEKLTGAGLLMDDSYSSARYVAALAPIPLLLIHGTADTVTPFTHAKRLFADAKEPKRLVAIEGAGHTEAFAPRFGRQYQDLVVDFMMTSLDPSNRS